MSSNPFFQSLNQLRNACFLSRATVKTINSLLVKPKGAPSGYAMFFKEHYPMLKRQNPNVSIPELGQQIGAKWNQLSETTKKAYLDKAVAGIQAARQKNEAFRASLAPIQSQALHMVRLNTRARHGLTSRRYLSDEDRAFLDALPPSPSPNGRIVFLSKQIKNGNPQVPVKQRLAEASAKWENLGQSEKAHWENIAKKEQDEFQQAMKKFLKKH